MPNPPLKDRKTSLVLVGILDILIGLACALMAPLMISSYFLAKTAPTTQAQATLTLGMTAMTCAIFLGAAVLAIWLGVGLCLCRRWARTLLLIAGWFGLVVGVLSMAYMIFAMPNIFNQIAQKPNITPEIISIMKWVFFSIISVIYILVPGVHALVLGHPNVRDTCQFRDKKSRWTDTVPAPVLALSLQMALTCITMFALALYPAVPFFGLMLTGLPATIFCVASSALAGWLTWGTYRLQTQAWWGNLCYVALFGLSVTITFSTHSVFEIYEKMNMPAQELEAIKQNPMFQGNQFIYLMGAWMAIYGAYVLYCRKYFVDKAK
jgi:MFS family permease